MFDSSFILEYNIPTELCDAIIHKQNTPKKLLYSSMANTPRGYKSMFLHDLCQDLYNDYIIHLEKFKNSYCQHYPIFKTMPRLKMSASTASAGHGIVKLQRYEINKNYNVEHCENDGSTAPYSVGQIKRVLVFMTYLNTIEEGGGTNFPYLNKRYNATKGLTLIWPAYFTHTHIGVPASKDVKYILTGWFEAV